MVLEVRLGLALHLISSPLFLVGFDREGGIFCKSRQPAFKMKFESSNWYVID